MAARPEDAVFARHVLERQYASEVQVQECLKLVERLRGEMELEDTLGGVLVKKGYLSSAQATAIEQAIDPAKRSKNALPGYQLLERIGFGAMGAVYRAHHLKLDIPVAVKVLRLQLATSPTQIKRLTREAQLAAKLNHPNIVRGLDVGEAGGFHYLAMEFVDGTTVRERLNDGPLEEKEALRIVRDVARALEHAHQKGVIHRDIKPGNIMLTTDGKVKLVDFGLARGLEPSDLTLEHASIGTPQYVAPEQAGRGRGAGPRSDLFSLGASLYHMVTGRPPFDGDNLGEIFQNVLTCHFPSPETLAPDLSVNTLYLIHRLMRGDPRQRPQSATALLKDLERIEQGERVAPSDFEGDHRAWVKRRRRRFAAYAGAATVVLGAVGFFVALSHARTEEENERAAACRALDAAGAKEAEAARDAATLRALARRLEGLNTGGCNRDEIDRLVRRRTLLEDELETHDTIADCLKALGEDAPFGMYLGLLRKRSGRLPATRNALRAAEEKILLASERALSRRAGRLNFDRPESGAAALATLTAFKNDLERYAEPDETIRDRVETARKHVRNLVDVWTQTERDFRIVPGDFRTTADELEKFLRAREKARGPAERDGVPQQLLDLFPVKRDEREQELRQAERTHFEDIARRAREMLNEGRNVEALRLVRGFLPRAHVTAPVKQLVGEIERRLDDAGAAQSARIDAEARAFEAALQDRRWAEPAAIVGRLLERNDWTPDSRERIGVLERRAKAFLALDERFRKRRPGESPRAVREVEDLLAALALDDGPGHVRMRGLLLVGEHFAAHDPRQGVAHLRAGIALLEPLDDPWVPDLHHARVAAEKRNREREQQASDTFKRLTTPNIEHHTQLVLIKELLKKTRHSLRYTDFVDANLKGLLSETERLKRLVDKVDVRLAAGLPVEGYRVLLETGTVRFRWDFREWHPDEKQAPEGKGKEWLEPRTEQFWSKILSPDDPEWPFKYRRAKHQLRTFSRNLVPFAGGGAILAGGARHNYDRWLLKRDDEIEVVILENPLLTDADWSIEVEVSWTEITKKAYGPSYFALAAGEFQLGLVYALRDPTGNQSGAARGVFLHVGESMTAHLDRRLKDFAPDKKLRRKSEQRRLARLALAPGAKVRLRLERKDRELIGWVDGREVVSLRPARRKDLQARMSVGDRTIFRILSLVQCRVHEVVVEGKLEEQR